MQTHSPLPLRLLGTSPSHPEAAALRSLCAALAEIEGEA